jgi:probable HAF family extracellular repeat protein
MKSRTLTYITAMTLFAALALPIRMAAQHTRYKLVVVGTLGGPQSYGDPGHGAANINNRGTAVGVADTSAADPFYPNFNPWLSGNIGSYPFIYHAFTTRGAAIVDLGGLPGGYNSVASFITENGLVTGQSLNGSIDPFTGWPAEDPVLWKDGRIINLGSLGGYEGWTSRANSHGQVVGVTTNAVPDPFSLIYYAFYGFSNGTQTRAFLWDEKHGMQDLGTLGGPDAVAAFINKGGQVAGSSYTTSTGSRGDPFLWENGKMIDLGTLGGTSAFSTGLNNRGQVVGQSNLAGDIFFHPFTWTAPGPMRDLGTLGGATGTANAINDSGEVVGLANTPTSTHAYLWRHGKMTDLGTLDGDCFSGAFGINARTQVVGQSITCDSTGFRAFLWQNGTMTDLNVFVPPGVDLTLTDVEQINDRGEMFGIGTLANGEDRAFLLIPCGESEDGCIEAPLGSDVVAKSPAVSAAAPKTMTAAEQAILIKRMARMAGRNRGFGSWPRRQIPIEK